ncbi:MAG: glycosyltransferase family 2 protein [Flavobacteriales bacterium]|nr:glycosyltransferase family 2 protein [Flavobacteriales bacterium]
MHYPKVSVVILNFNTRQLLEQLLPFVLKTEYPNLEVVVADNASTDHSAELVKTKFPEVKLIELAENFGFAEGYNQALRQLDTDFWVLLNSDVEVPQNWLKPMMDLMLSNDQIAAVQPKILDYFKRDFFEYAGASGGFIDKHIYPFCRGRVMNELEADNGQYDDAKPVFWATGAAMLVRANVYKALNGLDADFFAHMEEIDLCWRIKNAGSEVWVCPQSTVYHMGGGTLAATSPRKTFLNFRNNLCLMTKNLKASELVRVLAIRLVLDGVAGLKFLVDGKPGLTWAVVKAHWAFFIKFGYWASKRKRVPNQLPLKQHTGVYGHSLIVAHFAKGKKKFSDL